MRSPVIALVWTAWSRHRIGFTACAAVLAAVAIVNGLLTTVVPSEALIAGSTLPLVCVLGFVLNSLLFVEQAGSLSSHYPRYLFALPVRTRTLALWPLLLGSTCAGLLWVTTSFLIDRLGDYRLPVLVPALGLAATMAWAHALAWAPIAIPWVREVTNIAAVAALSALPIWLTVAGHASSGRLGALFAAYIMVACALGWAAVACDRHGRAWRLWPSRLPVVRVIKETTYHRRKRPFRSAFEAQVWYEWSCHGVMLNGFVAAAFMLIWGILISAGRQGDLRWFATIVVILLIVAVTMIAATGASFGRLRPFWVHRRGLNSFVHVRPMSTFQFVTAKFRMAGASVLLSWALAVALTAIWILISGNLDNATAMSRDLLNRNPGPRGPVIIVLACVLLPALSWRLLTGPIAPVLTDRQWVAHAAVWGYLSMIIGLALSGLWLKNHPEEIVRVYSTVPWLVVGAAILKGAVAVTAFRIALVHGLMSSPNILAIVSLWLLFAGCAVAMAILVGPPSAVAVSWPVVALGAASLVPLARFPLATLALDWNRHR